MSAPTLSIIVASAGRQPGLMVAIDSIQSQMQPGDELLLSVNDNAPWGHAARNEMMDRAGRDMLMFMDDDDMYLPGGLQAVRDGVGGAIDKMHIFRMEYGDGSIIWRTPNLREGEVSTQMLVVPREKRGMWGDRYAGDFDFAKTSSEAAGDPVFHEAVIARYRVG